MFTLTNKTYADPAKRREYHRERYLANRDKVLAEANARNRALRILEPQKTITEVGLEDADRVPDIRPMIDRERRDNLEGIRLRLIWASGAGGVRPGGRAWMVPGRAMASSTARKVHCAPATGSAKPGRSVFMRCASSPW
jgi:hypothetical protein